MGAVIVGTVWFAFPTVSGAAGSLEPSQLASQRREIWSVLTHLTATSDPQGRPLFESWYGEDAAFAPAPNDHGPRGIEAFSRVTPRSLAADADVGDAGGDIPLLTYVLYSPTAYRHIRRNELYLRTRLRVLNDSGELDTRFPDDHRIPEFPDESAVLKTAWWPVAPDRLTALPVWDPELNPPRSGGNPYTGWQRVVAVDPVGAGAQRTRAPVDFAGRSFPEAHRVALDTFFYIKLDAALAGRMARDRTTHKAAIIALGRDLQAGDYLALVSMNLAIHESGNWRWATFWWHDHPESGPFARQRPDVLVGEWRHYLMQASFDAEQPVASDGGPHVCFDPYLEGRFPDGGHGGGTVSNCVTCHRRASYPAVNFLPVTRGAANRGADPAYASGRLRTDFLWSLALHAAP